MKKILLILLPLLILTGCSKKNENDYLEQAQKGYEENNFQQVLTSYESLLSEFPQSESAPKALLEIAKLYQSYLIKNISNEESVRLAIENFEKIVENYPQSQEAPMALFLTGFIQANELHDYEKATETYNRFLEKYADHEMASSAKEELENMGLSPEEILRRKITLSGNE